MAIVLTLVNFWIINRVCFFWAELYPVYTAQWEMYQTEAGPCHVWWWAFWASQPQLEQALSLCWGQSLHMSLCQMLIADFQINLRTVGKNSLAGWFMFQCSRYSVLWKQCTKSQRNLFYQVNIFILVLVHTHVGFGLLCSVPICHSFQKEEGNSWYGCRT